MAFQPGNKLAALGDHSKRKILTQSLISELNEIDPSTKMTRMRRVIQQLITNAEGGDNQAIMAIFDRIEGKPTATIEAGEQLAKLLIAWAE
jgi:ribosomal protein L17